MKKEDLRAIMRRAWEIKKEDSRNIFSLCLKMAWAEYKNPAPVEKPQFLGFKSWFINKNFTQNQRLVIQEAVMCETIEEIGCTEKAVKFRAESHKFGFLTFWCPKSCLLIEADVIAAAKKRKSGLDYNRTLIAFAKANGVKGVRTGMKTATLIRKIEDAGLEIPERA